MMRTAASRWTVHGASPRPLMWGMSAVAAAVAVLLSNGYWPEGWLIAVNGTGEWVGLTMMTRNPATPHRANISLTGVARAYRGQGIALALKVVAAQMARDQGVRDLTTLNHSGNSAMLAVNRKLGYQPLAGIYWLVKRSAERGQPES